MFSPSPVVLKARNQDWRGETAWRLELIRQSQETTSAWKIAPPRANSYFCVWIPCILAAQ